MNLDERVEAGARVYADSLMEVDGTPATIAARDIIYAAFPELFSNPPQAWIAPWEADDVMVAAAHVSDPLGCDVEWAKDVYPPVYAAFRTAHLNRRDGAK